MNLIVNNFTKYWNNQLFLYLIIFFLIFGPAIPDIIGTTLSIIALAYLVKYREFNENFFILIIFYLLLLIPNIFSIYFPDPFFEQLVNIRYFLFAFYLSKYIEINIDSLIKFILFITLFLSFDLTFQYIFEYNIIGIPINAGHELSRASSLFGDELIAGLYILKFGLPVIGYYLFKKKYTLSFFILIIYEVAIIASGERMTFLLYALGLFLIFLFNIKKIRFFLIVLLSYLLIFTIGYYNSDKIKNRVSNFLNSSGLSEDTKFINSGHGAHFMTAYEIFLNNKIFGTGHKTFRIACNEEKIKTKIISQSNGCSTHPHNLYFELLSDSGLFGIISFILVISILIIKFIKNKIYKSNLNGFFASFLITIWPISSSGNFFNNRIAITNFLILGIILIQSNLALFKKFNK